MIAEGKKVLLLPLEPGVLPLLTGINDFLTQHGVQGYIVGGFVRDTILGRDTADIDIALTTDALEITPGLATAIGGRYIPMDETNRISRIVIKNAPHDEIKWQIDFSTITDGIQQDLKERDFTIDAIAVRLEDITCGITDIEPVDPFDGLQDIDKRVIKVVSDDSFQSDALRLLRGVRLSVELGFTIDSHTEELMQQQCHLITNVAGERIREELLKLLATPDTGNLIFYLDELGLLTAIIPELAQTIGVDQPKEHHWNVFKHSVKTVDAIGFVLKQGNWEHANKKILDCMSWSTELEQHFNSKVSGGSTRYLLLKLTALLHDIAKPQTKAVDEKGKTRFLGHAIEGAEIVADILERLRFSAKEIKLVVGVVRHHLRPVQTCQDELPSRKAIYRYFRDTEDAAIDTLFFSLADHLATRGPNLNVANWQQHAALIEHILTRHEEQENITSPPKIISGYDIMNNFNLDPGQKIGELLEAVREAQASKEIAGKEEALSYVKRLLGRDESSSCDNNGTAL